MDQKRIGEFLTQLRLESNMTQEVLASKLGVSNRTVSRWENGRNMPDLSLFEPICQLFDISVEEFLTGARIPQENNTSIDIDKAIQEYKDEKKQKRKRTTNKIGVFAIIFSLLASIGMIVATFFTNSVVHESAIMFDTPHYDIAYILFNCAKVSSIIFVFLLISLIVNKKVKNNILVVSLISSVSVFVIFGIGFTIFVESNYEYDEPYGYYFSADDMLKTDQHNPYEKDMKYYPFHDKMVKYAKKSNTNTVTDTDTEFNYIGYELFGTKLVWTNEYPWTDEDDSINYWMEYICADNALSKGFLISFYSITMASSNWELIEDTDDYSLYECDGDYMVAIISGDDLLLQRLSDADTLGVKKKEIISSALEVYKSARN